MASGDQFQQHSHTQPALLPKAGHLSLPDSALLTTESGQNESAKTNEAKGTATESYYTQPPVPAPRAWLRRVIPETSDQDSSTMRPITLGRKPKYCRLAEEVTGGGGRMVGSIVGHSCPHGSRTGGGILGEREVLKLTCTEKEGPQPPTSLSDASGPGCPPR